MATRKKLIKASFWIEADSLAALKRISEDSLIPVSRLVRKGIQIIIKEYAGK
jgi:hypothetical protein